jgi:hypothetical protein
MVAVNDLTLGSMALLAANGGRGRDGHLGGGGGGSGGSILLAAGGVCHAEVRVTGRCLRGVEGAIRLSQRR